MRGRNSDQRGRAAGGRDSGAKAKKGNGAWLHLKLVQRRQEPRFRTGERRKVLDKVRGLHQPVSARLDTLKLDGQNLRGGVGKRVGKRVGRKGREEGREKGQSNENPAASGCERWRAAARRPDLALHRRQVMAELPQVAKAVLQGKGSVHEHRTTRRQQAAMGVSRWYLEKLARLEGLEMALLLAAAADLQRAQLLLHLCGRADGGER